MVRVAVLDRERCKPEDCGLVCIRFCPPVRNGLDAIKLGEDGKPVVNERLCVVYASGNVRLRRYPS